MARNKRVIGLHIKTGKRTPLGLRYEYSVRGDQIVYFDNGAEIPMHILAERVYKVVERELQDIKRESRPNGD